MSVPILACSIVKAALDEPTYRTLVETMRYNVKRGAFTVYPCEHNPRCMASDELLEKLAERLFRDLPGLERFAL